MPWLQVPPLRQVALQSPAMPWSPASPHRGAIRPSSQIQMFGFTHRPIRSAWYKSVLQNTGPIAAGFRIWVLGHETVNSGFCIPNEVRFLKFYKMNILDNFKSLLCSFHTFGLRSSIDVLCSVPLKFGPDTGSGSRAYSKSVKTKKKASKYI